MRGGYEVDVETLREAGRRLRRCADDLADQPALQVPDVGSSTADLARVFDQLGGAVALLQQALAGTAEDLDKTVAGYEEADHAAYLSLSRLLDRLG